MFVNCVLYEFILYKRAFFFNVQFYRNIYEGLLREVKALQQNTSFSPGLAIVQVGLREDSNVYIRMKIKAAQDLSIKVRHYQLPNTTTEADLLNTIDKLNNDPDLHGIIVQMPLDSVNEINSHRVTDAVSPKKDVDG